jgi:hypothetical protein
MNNQQIQQHLLYTTKIKVQSLNSKKIKGVTAIWEDDTAYISIYFDEKPTEEELEDSSDICTEIIAAIPGGMLEDNYRVLRSSEPLPKDFLAYQRDGR